MLYDVEERSSSFFDDLEEKQIIDELSHNIGDGLRQDAGPRFAQLDVDQDHAGIKTVQDEISYYGVTGVSSVSDLARKETQI